MPASDMFRLSENIRGQDYLLATYCIELPAEADILAKAASYAVGQTIGTWVEVPGVTAEMRDRHLGRVVKVLEAPPVDVGAGQARRPRGAGLDGRGAGRAAVRDRGRAQARRGARPAPRAQHDQAVHGAHPGGRGPDLLRDGSRRR